MCPTRQVIFGWGTCLFSQQYIQNLYMTYSYIDWALGKFLQGTQILHLSNLEHMHSYSDRMANLFQSRRQDTALFPLGASRGSPRCLRVSRQGVTYTSEVHGAGHAELSIHHGTFFTHFGNGNGQRRHVQWQLIKPSRSESRWGTGWQSNDWRSVQHPS